MNTKKPNSLKQRVRDWLDQPIKSRPMQRISEITSSKWFATSSKWVYRVTLGLSFALLGYIAGDTALSHLRNAREEKTIAENTQKNYSWLSESIDGFLRSYNRLTSQGENPYFRRSDSKFDLESEINADYRIFYSKDDKTGYHLIKIENTRFSSVWGGGGYAELCDSTAILLNEKGEVEEVRIGDTFKHPETGKVPENREMVTNISLKRRRRDSNIFDYKGLGFFGTSDVVSLPDQYQQAADLVLKIKSPAPN